MRIEPTSELAGTYVWFAQYCLNEIGGYGVKALSDGQVTVICKFTPDKATLIATKAGNFLCHPRSGKLNALPYFDNQLTEFFLTGVAGGGWRASNVEIENRYVYPLQDDDHGTFIIKVQDKSVSASRTNAENYGNNWWWDGKKDGAILSWHGAPNITFPVDHIFNIPGLSQIETIIGETPYYTCFDKYVYRGGSVIATAPEGSLVAGAFYKDAALYSVCVIRREIGIWLQLQKQKGKGWLQIGPDVQVSALSIAAFPRRDGSAFVYQTTVYNTDKMEVLQVIQPLVSGTRTVKGRGGYDEGYYQYEASQNLWAGMQENTVVTSRVTTQAKFDYKNANGSATTQKNVPIYRGEPASTVSVVLDSGPACVLPGTLVNFKIVANGVYCSVEWSGVDCVSGGSASKIVETCNSDFSVTATLQPQGISGTYSRTTVLLDLTLSGPQDSGDINNPGLTGVETYTATNAVGNVIWSGSNCTVDQSGHADFSGRCGTATITVTDDCGRTASLDVAVGAGMWMQDFSFVFQGTPGPCGNGFSRTILSGGHAYNGCYATYNQPNVCPICINDVGISAPVDPAVCALGFPNDVCQKWDNVQGKFDWGCATP